MTNEFDLIQLPTGTERRGLHLSAPHGQLVWDGRKTSIAKARPFDISGPWILISGGRAYGTMDIGSPVPVGIEEFDSHFNRHRVTTSERQKWWPEKDTLYLSAIKDFTPFARPMTITVVPGMQTVVEAVEFKDSEPECLEEHCERVQLVIEGLVESMDEKVDAAIAPEEIEQPEVVVPPPFSPNALDMLQSRIHKSFTVVADDLLAWGYLTEKQRIALSGAIGTALETFIVNVNDIPSEVEGLPSLAAQLQSTHLDGTHALLLASKEKEDMPYDPNNPPAKLSGMPAKAQRIWVHAYNSCEYDDTARCNKIAYGAVKNAGYYQDEDGNWHSRKDVKNPSSDHPCLEEPRMKEPCPKCQGKAEPPIADKKDNRFLGWLKGQYEKVMDDLKSKPEEKPALAAFKTFTAKDGRPSLLTWTTNAFEDREGETFKTKAIEEYVSRHRDDDVKGEFWFWHLPGAKFGDIHWQAVSGRFLVEAGPFDDTPIGHKLYEFFSQYGDGHQTIAPGGWGTSHGYYYVPEDRGDKAYDWFDKFETTVLPKSAASNQHSPPMEVLPMDEQQKQALAAIGGDELVKMVLETGEERTKELEEQGIAFKSEETPAEETEQAEVETKADAVEQVQEAEEVKTAEIEPEAETQEVQESTDVDSSTKAAQELAQQIVAGLNLGQLATAIKSLQDSVEGVASRLEEQDERLKALEDVGGDPLSPLIPLSRATFFQASKVAQTESDEKLAASAQPTVPSAIAQMAQRIPI